MVKKVVEIGANVKGAVKEIKTLYDGLLETELEANKLEESLVQTTDKGEKGFKGLNNATGIVRKGFQALGTALKGIGIGFLLSAFAGLTAIFSQNQQVIDVTKSTFNAFNLAVNDLIKFIDKVVPKIRNFFKEFGENPAKKIKELGEFFRLYLVNQVAKAVEGFNLLGESFKSLIKGDFGTAWNKLSASASKFVDGVTGVDDSMNKLKKTAEDYYEQGKKIQQGANWAKISKAQLQGLVEEYDRLAEKQRQIRDDETKTIQERIDANDKLGKILNQQEQAQSGLAGAIVAQAQAELSLNNNIENQVALIEAQNEAKAVLAQVEGFRSEQLVNQVALEKELLEYNQLAIEGTNKRALANTKLNDLLEKDSLMRLENERLYLVQEGQLEEDRLKKKVDSLKKGTLAWQEANQELLTFREEQNLAISEKEDEIATATLNKQLEDLQEIFENESLSYAVRFKALQDYNEAVKNTTQLSENDKLKIYRKTAKAQSDLDEAVKKQKLATYDAIGNASTAMSQLVGEQTALGKTLAVAGALISTYQGIANEIGTKTVTPYEIAFKIANIATVAAVGFKSVKDILAVEVPNSGGAGGSAPQAQAPDFNIVGQSSTNQLAQTIGEQEQAPVKAYVVATDITTQQSFDRKVVQSASFG